MKTIIRTLTTIALISAIQCVWGSGSGTESDPRVLEDWADITDINKNNATYDATNGAYTLIAPEDESETKYYKFNITSSTPLSTKMNLVIPKNVNVTNGKFIRTDEKLEIKNNGTFENLTHGSIYTRAEDSSITFSSNENITNSRVIYTEGENSSIIFSNGTADKPQIVLTSGTSQSNYGKIYLKGSNSSMTIGQYSILSFVDYGKFYVDDNNTHTVTLDGTIAIKSSSASVNLNKMTISSSDSKKPGTIDITSISDKDILRCGKVAKLLINQAFYREV